MPSKPEIVKEYYQQNKQKILARKRAYYLENREEILAQKKEYAADRKQETEDYQKAYRQSERGKESKSKSNKKRYEKIKVFDRVRRKANNYKVPIAEIFAVLKSPCKICGSADNLTVDHMHPVSKGGQSTPENLQSLCKSCNSWKHNKILLAKNSGVVIGL